MNIFSPKALHLWYENNRRALPWRLDPKPYHIWLSEIILQQTRVAQGIAYYHRFIEAFPTVADLAQADEDRVMKLWQGLGYYNRARNLRATARIVHLDFNDVFPSTYNGLLALPGIGPYTAAAISSIAYGQPHAVVDGNVTRVIARLFDIRESVNKPEVIKLIQDLADAWLDPTIPGDHNQAIMELGAMVCTPKQPKCEACPIMTNCAALGAKSTALVPHKTKKLQRSKRFLHYLVLDSNGKTAINQRGENDIWAKLFEFPMIESKSDKQLDLATLSAHFGLINPRLTRVNRAAKHVLTHQDLYAQFYHIQTDSIAQDDFELVSFDELHTFALPRLIDRYLENYDAKDGKKRR